MAATVVCELEKNLELARLETSFWESCQAVRASSVSLHKIHAFLMGELLDLEADKRRALSQRMGEMETQVAEMKSSWHDEVTSLREQLEAAKTRSPQQVPPPSSPHITNNNQQPSLDSNSNHHPPVNNNQPSPTQLSDIPPITTEPEQTLPRSHDVSHDTQSESTLIPAPELVEVSDIRIDTTSGEEESIEHDKPHPPRERRGRKSEQSKSITSLHTETEQHQESQVDLTHGSTEEESDIEATAMNLRRKKKRKLTNLTADVSHAIAVQLNERGKVGGEEKSSQNMEDVEKKQSDRVNDRGKVEEGVVNKVDEFKDVTMMLDPVVPTRGRGRGRPRGRPRKRRPPGRITSSIPIMTSSVEVGEFPGDNVLPSGVEYVEPQLSDNLNTTVVGEPVKRKRGRPRGSGKKKRASQKIESSMTTNTNPIPPVGSDSLNVSIVVVTVPASNNELATTIESSSDKPTISTTTTTTTAVAPSDVIPTMCLSNDSNKATVVGETNTPHENEETVENAIEPTPTVAIDNTATCEVIVDDAVTERQHSPSPEIPLQNSSLTNATTSPPEAAQNGLRKGATNGGGHLLEKIVNSLVERSHVSTKEESRRGRGSRGKRKTITAKKPTQKLSVVDNDQVQQRTARGRRRKGVANVSTAGLTVPKLK